MSACVLRCVDLVSCGSFWVLFVIVIKRVQHLVNASRGLWFLVNATLFTTHIWFCSFVIYLVYSYHVWWFVRRGQKSERSEKSTWDEAYIVVGVISREDQSRLTFTTTAHLTAVGLKDHMWSCQECLLVKCQGKGAVMSSCTGVEGLLLPYQEKKYPSVWHYNENI